MKAGLLFINCGQGGTAYASTASKKGIGVRCPNEKRPRWVSEGPASLERSVGVKSPATAKDSVVQYRIDYGGIWVTFKAGKTRLQGRNRVPLRAEQCQAPSLMARGPSK